jgi:hypothetical protein
MMGAVLGPPASEVSQESQTSKSDRGRFGNGDMIGESIHVCASRVCDARSNGCFNVKLSGLCRELVVQVIGLLIVASSKGEAGSVLGDNPG